MLSEKRKKGHDTTTFHTFFIPSSSCGYHDKTILLHPSQHHVDASSCATQLLRVSRQDRKQDSGCPWYIRPMWTRQWSWWSWITSLTGEPDNDRDRNKQCQALRKGPYHLSFPGHLTPAWLYIHHSPPNQGQHLRTTHWWHQDLSCHPSPSSPNQERR